MSAKIMNLSNVMLTDDGRVVLRSDGLESAELSYRQGFVRMAPPEVAYKDWSIKGDTWCLGKTLERCVNGRQGNMSDYLNVFIQNCGRLDVDTRPLVTDLMDVSVFSFQ